MTKPTPTVFIIDSDEGICKALKLLIHSIGIEVKTYINPTNFIEDYTRSQPGCLILDVRLPEISGFKTVEILKERDMHIPIIFLTEHGSIRMAVRAMKMGAMDFLEKPFDEQELLEKVQEGISRDEENRKKQLEREKIIEHLARLSERERQVLNGLLEGRNSKSIALSLGINSKTVEFHRTNLIKKMEVNSMMELMMRIMKIEVHQPSAGTLPQKEKSVSPIFEKVNEAFPVMRYL
jgi:FixJ family two-component response regulator